MENLSTTSFARDYHMTTNWQRRRTARFCHAYSRVADHGAFDACADPSRWPAGFMNICTGSYDIPVAHLKSMASIQQGVGRVAYRCSFRVTEAVYSIERAIEVLAHKLVWIP